MYTWSRTPPPRTKSTISDLLRVPRTSLCSVWQNKIIYRLSALPLDRSWKHLACMSVWKSIWNYTCVQKVGRSRTQQMPQCDSCGHLWSILGVQRCEDWPLIMLRNLSLTNVCLWVTLIRLCHNALPKALKTDEWWVCVIYTVPRECHRSDISTQTCIGSLQVLEETGHRAGCFATKIKSVSYENCIEQLSGGVFIHRHIFF